MLPSDYMHVLRQPHHEQLYSKYYVWFPWEINCIQQLIGDCGLEFTLITEITPIMSSSSWPPCPSWKKKNHQDILTTHKTLRWHREDALALERFWVGTGGRHEDVQHSSQ